MTDDVDSIFGSRLPPRPSFTQRVAPSEARAPAEPHYEVDESGIYKPYGFMPAGTIGEGCDIRRWLAGTDIPEGIEFQYRFLMQVGYVGEEQLRLFLPDCIIVIEGKRLFDLRKKLARRLVTFIQQFNARVWDVPATDEPLVASIEIIRPETTKPR